MLGSKPSPTLGVAYYNPYSVHSGCSKSDVWAGLTWATHGAVVSWQPAWGWGAKSHLVVSAVSWMFF